MGRPVINRHKVPKRQWAKWNNLAKRVFNDTYFSLRPSMQFAFLHPDCPPMSRAHWRTTRWNVAWTAACAIDRRTARLVRVITVKRRGK